jgi:hypothetical protein
MLAPSREGFGETRLPLAGVLVRAGSGSRFAAVSGGLAALARVGPAQAARVPGLQRRWAVSAVRRAARYRDDALL